MLVRLLKGVCWPTKTLQLTHQNTSVDPPRELVVSHQGYVEGAARHALLHMPNRRVKVGVPVLARHAMRSIHCGASDCPGNDTMAMTVKQY